MSNLSASDSNRSQYRILGLVGQGQFGQVFCAIHRQTGQLVALKNLDQHRFPTYKFLRELRFLLSLRHPHIVTCHALEHNRTGRYLVMDYCEGGTVRNVMDNSALLPHTQAIQLVLDILAGLEQAHSRNIVHCDIKPENTLLSLRDRHWVARISDFGVARLSQELGYHGAGNTGSPAYMAPERFYGQYSKSSDLYSVGVFLYELLVGHRPFSGTPNQLMSAHLNHPLKLPDTLAEVWHPILKTALQKLAARRFQSATEMRLAIQQAIAQSEMNLPSRDPPVSFLVDSSPVPNLLVVASCFPLSAPVTAIGLMTESSAALTNLYLVSGAHLFRWCAQQMSDRHPVPHLLPSAPWHCADPIQAIAMRSHGCFVITTRAVFLVDSEATSLGKSPPDSLRPIAQLSQPCQVAIDAKGNWLACLTTDPLPGSLKFVPLLAKRGGWLTPETMSLATWRSPRHPTSILALDAHHVAVVSAVNTDPNTRVDTSEGSVLDLFTRRGHRLESLHLPLPLRYLRTTPTPYRLIGTDALEPNILVMIDLRPYRIKRLKVAIAPQFCEITHWGLILANTAGYILLLDHYGHVVGNLQGPSHVTAIAYFQRHLLLTTWNGAKGGLYIADLSQSEIDLMF